MTGYKQIHDYPTIVREADIVAVVWDGDDDYTLLTRGGHRIYLGDDVVVDALVDRLLDDGQFLDLDRMRAHRIAQNEQAKKERDGESDQ